MKCRVCGYNLDPNKAFCDMCGTRVVAPKPDTPTLPQAEQLTGKAPEVPIIMQAEPQADKAPEVPIIMQAEQQTGKMPEVPIIAQADHKQNAPVHAPANETEFSWDVHDFPKPKKPEDIPLEWPDYDAPDVREKFSDQTEERIKNAIEKREPVVMVTSDASEGFVAVPDTKIEIEDTSWTNPMEESPRRDERFFTFHRKNEEFQRLLDQEYERVSSRRHDAPMRDEAFRFPKSPQVRAEELNEFERMLMEGTKAADELSGDTLPLNLLKMQEEVEAQERARTAAFELRSESAQENAPPVAVPTPPPVAVPVPTPPSITALPTIPVSAEPKSANQARLEAMSLARDEYLRSLGLDPEDDGKPLTAERTAQEQKDAGPAPADSAAIVLDATPERAQAGPDAIVLVREPADIGPAGESERGAQPAGESEPGAKPAGESEPGSKPAGESEPVLQPAEKSETASQPAEKTEAISETSDVSSAGVAAAAASPAISLSDTAERSMKELFDVPDDEPEKPAQKKKKRGCLFEVILILILAVALAEAAVIGLRHYMPDHMFTKSVTRVEQMVIINVKAGVQYVRNTVESVLERFGGTSGTKIEEEEPDSNAYEFDLAAIVRINNDNIESITVSPKLRYDVTKTYEIEGIGTMGVVEDDGTRADIYGCIIAYNSTWVDYVNTGEDETCFQYLLKDGPAYEAAKAFTKAGKIEERFGLLALGEIRTDGEFYYAFAREQIEVGDGGKTVQQEYVWIYRVQDIEGDIKIVDYTAVGEA